MKVPILQIPEEGKRYEGEEPSEILELNGGPSHARALGPITYAFDVGVSEDGLWGHGSVSVPVECECVRCLEKFQRPLAVPDFAFQMELEGKETVDLTEQIREDILLALPAHPHCDWDGKKTCKASFSHSVVETLDEQPDAWKVLDNLNL